jgi:hypothetical protein
MDAFNGLIALAACGWSLALIVLLGLSDSKSQRTTQRSARSVSPRLRLAAAVFTLLPGALLLAAGSAVAFLIWFGFVTIAGWAVAVVLAPPARHRE